MFYDQKPHYNPIPPKIPSINLAMLVMPTMANTSTEGICPALCTLLSVSVLNAFEGCYVFVSRIGTGDASAARVRAEIALGQIEFQTHKPLSLAPPPPHLHNCADHSAPCPPPTRTQNHVIAMLLPNPSVTDCVLTSSYLIHDP